MFPETNGASMGVAEVLPGRPTKRTVPSDRMMAFHILIRRHIVRLLLGEFNVRFGAQGGKGISSHGPSK